MDSLPAYLEANVVIFTLNDVYDMLPNAQGLGGIAEFATLLAQERAKVPKDTTIIVTLPGDFISGSALGEYCKGAHMIEILNYIGIDYVVVGNHEFDFGNDKLQERIQESNFQWFGANIRYKDTGNLFPQLIETKIHPLKTKYCENEDEEGINLGIFGLCTDNTPQLAYPGDDIEFQDILSTAKTCIKTLQQEKADVILALTHLSVHEDCELASKVRDIDIILGGHDHYPFTLYQGKTFIHKCGQNAYWLGKIELRIRKPRKNPSENAAPMIELSPQWSMIANRNISPDPKCRDILMKFMNDMKASLGDTKKVLGVLELPLYTTTSLLRGGECNMGHLVADALRHELKADIGLINGGFIRGDKMYPAKTDITTSILQEEMPFPRPAVLIKIQMKWFVEALNQHMSNYPQLSGSFPHVSGIQVQAEMPTDENIQENGSNLKVKSVKFMSSEANIDPESFVTVATTKFIVGGGDGCTAWLEGEVLGEYGKVAQVTGAYIAQQRIISYPEHEGRLMIIN